MKNSKYSLGSQNENEDETSDEFPEVDHIGLYTLGMYFILSTPLILSAARGLGYVFTTAPVSYRCLAKECENPGDTTLHPLWLPNAVPYTDGKPATCSRFTVQNVTDSCLTTVFTNDTEPCDAWVYDPEEITILNEWDLTCDNNLWKLTLPGTINNFGQFLGLTLCGHLSDKYGRRNLLVVATLMSSIFGLIRSFSFNYWMFITFEFLDAFSGSAVYSAAFVLGMELVGPKKRALASILTCTMYIVFVVFLGLFAMWFRSWRVLLRIFYTAGLFALFLPFIVPDSVRWLLSKERIEEAEAVLRKIAAGNKIEISEKSILLIRNWKNKNHDKVDTTNPPDVSAVRQVIGNRTVLIRLIICTYCWVANVFVYYGLSLGSIYVPGDKYINFILVSLVEIPALFVAWILADYLGRKPTLSLTFFLSGIFCIITIFIPADWGYLPLIVFLCGKFCITTAYHLIYMYTTEMFPTSLRHSLLGLCSMVGRIGSMSAPQTPLLAHYMKSLPFILYGVMGISASFLSLSFPETLGIKLPDTVCEAAKIGEARKKERSDSRVI
ncbi:organic cation/carnitine transporter 2-like [Neodiprion pinetum]|uniref:organic cation/carnitine transporter 2-like n=1 Tax=Neodiprion pinetum TaxID=441929 RepID=UPI001EDF2D4F|nr:solute carrier family 22 member 5-like [Neodiprion pinetum]XP_046480503.1 solute carrier family 22 member 5-like [Neodiprion pinetum]